MSINELPKEVCQKIFSHLTITERIAVQRVCKQWLSLITFSDVKNICFIATKSKHSADLFEALILSKRNVLLFENWKCVLRVLRKCKSLKSFSVYLLTDQYFEDENKHDLEEIGKNIRTLEIVRVHCEKILQKLIVEGSPDYNFTFGRNLKYLLGYCTELRELQVCVENALEWPISKEHAEQLLQLLFRQNTNLEKLYFAGYSIVHSMFSDDDTTLIELVNKYSESHRKTMKSLCFEESCGSLDRKYKCEFINLTEIRIKTPVCRPNMPSVDQFKNLEILQVDCDFKGEELYRVISQNVRLKVINFFGDANDSFVELVSMYCPLLVHLKIFVFTRNQVKLTDASLIHLMKLQKLEVLQIYGCNRKECKTITDEALSEFISKAPSIRVVAVNANAVNALLQKANTNPTNAYFGFLNYEHCFEKIPNNVYLSKCDLSKENSVHCYYFSNVYRVDYFDWKNIRMPLPGK